MKEREAMNKRKTLWCSIFVLLMVMHPISNVFLISSEGAEGKTLTLSQAVALATGVSREYKTTRSKIFLKQAEYEEAVKSIALKKKNMATFRWTPLLSFKFPEKADLADEYEFTYKPLQIQSEISSLNHKLSDIKYSVREEVSNLYVDIYTYQEIIAYKRKQLSVLEEDLKKNKARLAVGEALKEDVDLIESSIEGLNSEIALKERELENSKKELSDLISIDVTRGYAFENPYREADISRERLSYIEEETLKKSQLYYDAKLNTSLALTALNTNYSLMESQYGSKMSYISSYVAMAKSGAEIDSAEFKLYYGRFLTAIDKPWQGSIKILFIRIPKEWFKGAIDGVRYVEDDPYALYTSVLEYEEASKEQRQTEKDIRKQVDLTYENMITARNAYESVERQVKKSYEAMEKGRLKNKAGELPYSEYRDLKTEYENMELEKLEALKNYTQILYSYDRLTCGTITEILNEQELGINTGGSGGSFVTEDMSDGAYYYINTIVEENAFEIGVYIPEDCKASVNQFELWVEDTLIGERTPVGEMLRHLTLTINNERKVFLRLYEDGQFVSDAVINVSEYKGRLPIEVAKRQKETEKKVGAVSYSENKTTGMVNLKVNISDEEEIKYYKLVKDGKSILSNTPVSVEEELKYLSILIDDLSQVTVELYGGDMEKLMSGYINKEDMCIYGKIQE